MYKFRSFLSGSLFTGRYNENLNCMDGFGRYLFPDGSEYRGYFKDGQFHGFGRIVLAAPYKFIFKGEFENGVLIDIEDMVFGDGLRFKATFNDNNLNTTEWRYLTEMERRYTSELSLGVEPVGPYSLLTKQRPERHIPKGCYDTEEGIYKPTTGFILHVPPPFSKHRFVGCDKEVEWIRSNCRRGSKKPDEPMHHTDIETRIQRRIITLNVLATAQLCDDKRSCNANLDRKAYFPKMCCKQLYDFFNNKSYDDDRKGDDDDDDDDDDDNCEHKDGGWSTKNASSDIPISASSTSRSSFSTQPLIKDMQESIATEVAELKMPEGCAQLSIDESFLMQHRQSSIHYQI